MIRIKRGWLPFLFVWLCLFQGAVSAAPPPRPIYPVRSPGLDQQLSQGAGSTSGASAPDTMAYHGGPLLTAPVKVYYVWYGNWTGNAAVQILTELAANIGHSPYFNINGTYSDGSGRPATSAISFGGSTADNYSRGTQISDNDVQTIVSTAITKSGGFPNDPTAVYYVLSSKDVVETSGFGTQYCGWHTYGTIGGNNLKYAFVGDPSYYMSACAAQNIGPNGSAPADAMASVIAHELDEMVTDPNLNAWYDSTGEEDADKCAWTFGQTYKTADGAAANMKLGPRDFLIQQVWLYRPGNGYCALAAAVETGTPGSDIPVTADYDGDGIQDLAVFRPSNGHWYVLLSTTNRLTDFATLGMQGDIPVPGHYNGPGKAEVAVFRPSNGTWYFLNGGQQIAYGMSGDIPVPGDYDGTGTTDVAVFRPSNGTWYILNHPSIRWGTAGDIPTPGNYAGPGPMQIAVFRPSNGLWYFFSTGNTISWGIPGDVPVPGNYSGTGVTQVAMYRPSTGYWYIQPTGQAIQWGTGGDIPAPLNPGGAAATQEAVFRNSNNTWYIFQGNKAIPFY